jgi:hypothetical protein
MVVQANQETQPKVDLESLDIPDFMSEGDSGAAGGKNFWGEIIASAPGIDEVMVFTSVIKYKASNKKHRKPRLRFSHLRHCSYWSYSEAAELSFDHGGCAL